MRILSLQALRGPNYWSHKKSKLIQVRLEIEGESAKEYKSIVEFIKLNAACVDLLKDGKFPKNAEEVFASLCLFLQNAGNNNFDFIATKKTIYPNIYNVVFEYQYEEAGIAAAYAAAQIIELLNEKKVVDFELEINKIKAVTESIKPIQRIINLVDEAKQKGIPILLQREEEKFQFGHGINGIDLNNEQEINAIAKLFLSNKNWRIPIIAVTGSNGKTTTTRLISHIINLNHKNVGFTTSDGVYIGATMVDEGDTTGPISAETVLRNKEVEVAVLETARGGIVRAGLGFDECDIAVVTNVQEDHLGISDIETMDELTQVKGVIVNAVKSGGIAVLNADNKYTILLGQDAACKVSWFSLNKNNPIFKDPKYKGNAIAFIENGQLVISNGNIKLLEIKLANIPITFNGTLNFMIENVLAATLACFTFGVDASIISKGLNTFFPSAEQTPGRMNIFEFKNCKVLVDFAHNIDGFIGIRDYLKTVDSKNKIGIIVGTGDRKDEDVIALGKLSAQMFDHILIHQVKFLRGKTAEELINLLVQGIDLENSGATWERVADELEPLKYALTIAKEGSFICALSDVLNKPIELVNDYKTKF